MKLLNRVVSMVSNQIVQTPRYIAFAASSSSSPKIAGCKFVAGGDTHPSHQEKETDRGIYDYVIRRSLSVRGTHLPEIERLQCLDAHTLLPTLVISPIPVLFGLRNFGF